MASIIVVGGVNYLPMEINPGRWRWDIKILAKSQNPSPQRLLAHYKEAEGVGHICNPSYSKFKSSLGNFMRLSQKLEGKKKVGM